MFVECKLRVDIMPAGTKWKLAEDITKYEHSSARFYITGRHAAYEVTDIETIFMERYKSEIELERNNSIKVSIEEQRKAS